MWHRFRQFIQIYLWKSDDLPTRKALACAIGIGISFCPFWGFHMLLAIIFAWIFRVNKILTMGFSAITIPPLIPFIVAIQVGLGGLVLNGKCAVKNPISNGFHLSSILHIGSHLLVGGLLLGVFVGITSYYIVLFVLQKNYQKKLRKN